MSDIETRSAEVIVDAETYGKVAPGVVVLSEPASSAAEQFRVLALKIEAAARQGTRVIAITSATAGEGRTLTAVNVALALGAGRRNKVALVDANLRAQHAGGMARALGLSPLTGLTQVLRGEVSLNNSLWRFGADDLWVLPGGVASDPTAVVGGKRMGELLTDLAERMDVVLVDAPPVLPTADLLALGRYVQGAVMVVRAGRTTREVVDMALAELATPLGPKLLGCALVGIAEEAGTTYELCRQHDKVVRRALPAHLPALPANRTV